MDKQLFDEAIGEPPPSTVDLDAVLARVRRTAWVRRMANPWAVTAAGVVVITLGAVVLLSPGGGSELSIAPAIQSSQPGTGSSAPPQPSSCGPTPTAPPTVEPPANAVPRLTAELTAAVQQQLPGAAFEANPDAAYPPGTLHGPFEFFHVLSPLVDPGDGSCGGGEDYFMARATTVTAGVKGNFMAVIARQGGVGSSTTECSEGQVADADHDCERRTGPNGEIIVISTLSHSRGVVYQRADVAKADGTGIIVQSENVAVSGKYGGPPESPAPPLNHDQLIRIALDPGLTLYP